MTPFDFVLMLKRDDATVANAPRHLEAALKAIAPAHPKGFRFRRPPVAAP